MGVSKNPGHIPGYKAAFPSVRINMWDIISMEHFPDRIGQQFTQFIPMLMVHISDPTNPCISVMYEQGSQNPKVYCYRARKGFFYAWILSLQPSLPGFDRQLAFWISKPCMTHVCHRVNGEIFFVSVTVNILDKAKERSFCNGPSCIKDSLHFHIQDLIPDVPKLRSIKDGAWLDPVCKPIEQLTTSGKRGWDTRKYSPCHWDAGPTRHLPDIRLGGLCGIPRGI